jgi:hypothetical protein
MQVTYIGQRQCRFMAGHVQQCQHSVPGSALYTLCCMHGVPYVLPAVLLLPTGLLRRCGQQYATPARTWVHTSAARWEAAAAAEALLLTALSSSSSSLVGRQWYGPSRMWYPLWPRVATYCLMRLAGAPRCVHRAATAADVHQLPVPAMFCCCCSCSMRLASSNTQRTLAQLAFYVCMQHQLAVDAIVCALCLSMALWCCCVAACLQGISQLRDVQALCASVFTFGPHIC